MPATDDGGNPRSDASTLKMYDELAELWPLLSPPSDYSEEAGVYASLLERPGVPIRTVLELGAGGGHTASHLKARYELTLVELAPGMQRKSEQLNPECRHVLGDMRTARLDETFDAVFIHDAIDHMTTLDDLRAAMTTAFVHVKPGGVALFCPDHLLETWEPETDHGGSDGPDRSLRFLEWSFDPDPDDGQCTTDYVMVVREADGTVRTVHDRHVHGLFSRADWCRLLAEVGFKEVETVPIELKEVDAEGYEGFLARKTA